MNTQIQKKEGAIISAFELDGIKTQLKSLLQDNPKNIESFKTKVLKMSLNYGMDKCSPESIIKCGLQAITLDLPLEAGQGYIVNYGGKAVFDCGYKGWQILAKRSGYSVLADVVYACDEFSQNGFGFDRELIFIPDFSRRESSNDEWAKKNLTGVIVSILEDDTGNKTHAFVSSDMIFKITGKSPSLGNANAKKFSPHENWAEQMFCAKAIKQVLSKFPIDLVKASQLNDAIQMINNTESIAQAENKIEQSLYPQDRFDTNYPKWVELVRSGKKQAMSIITQLSNSYPLTSEQLEKVMELKNCEVIEGKTE